MSSTDASYDAADKGPLLLGVWWAEVGVATLFVAMRFYTRFTMRSIGADDWTILLTLVMFMATMALCSVLVHYGLGRHITTLPVQEQAKFAKWSWIVQPFGIMTLVPGKISVVLLLQRLMPPNTRWWRVFLWVNMAILTIVMVVASIISFAQCDPPRALWEQVPNAKCWDPNLQADWATFGSAYSSFLDFVLALFPVMIVWDLKLSRRKKIALSVLLGFGILSGICAAIKTAKSRELSIRSDASWAEVPLYLASASEIFLNIVCASVPTLKPLFDNLTKGIPIMPTGPSSGGYSGRDRYGSASHKLHNFRKEKDSYGTASSKTTTIITSRGGHDELEQGPMCIECQRSITQTFTS
ncbi:hypothetical protein N0V82_008025 [Gnomoniopsis sp. IMI 355080]|nr:hypothetical protein N0V82_008025 [Gnomoniopsis sp. IMI 355080]